MQVFTLPDVHDRWPFPPFQNRWDDVVSLESLRWVESLGLRTPEQLEKFRAAHFHGIASMAYPHVVDPEHYRIACDFVNLLFLVDDITDVLGADEVHKLTVIALDALKNPTGQGDSDEHPFANMHRTSVPIISSNCLIHQHSANDSSFGQRLQSVRPSASVLDKFTNNYDLYLRAVIEEAEERDTLKVRDTLTSYLELRRNTGAVTCCFNLLLLPFDIPEDVLADPRIAQLETIGLDLVCVGNDILSFNVEQARGDIHNAVIVAMKEHGLSVQAAMDFIGAWYHRNTDEFCALMRDLPECKDLETRSQLKKYVAGLADWVTANYEWCLRSRRYDLDDKELGKGGWVVPLLERK
ncbi:isoprenoid synthase domain-containing protein [Roridomyces roridus]|uniref:Terpene synthase n=1 Tax=Roridomyces roridus TaxID=1738132 RepID=A0AAD7CCQ3_9AGAR|nr:isoprenoid synthase domain-containing protein [Roridomyces roridus]